MRIRSLSRQNILLNRKIIGSNPIVASPIDRSCALASRIMKKVNRKTKEKTFNRLRKTDNPSERIDKFGKIIDFHSYGQRIDKGWLVINNEAVSIGTMEKYNE